MEEHGKLSHSLIFQNHTKNIKLCIKFGFDYKNFKYIGEYLKDVETNEFVWFIKPKNEDFKKDTLIFSDKIKQNIYYQRSIYDITINNDNLKNLLSTFRESNIFYSDDLTGTDFKQVIDFKIKL